MKTNLVLALAVATPLIAVIASPALAETTGTAEVTNDPSLPTSPPYRVVESPLRPRDLQLTILASPDTLPFLSRDKQVQFADLLERQFKEAGFNGSVYLLDASDTPVPSLSRLEILLEDWRVHPGREADCDFVATLLTPKGPVFFGHFSGRAVDLNPPRKRNVRNQELKEAATDAIDQLYTRIQSEHLLRKEV